MESDNQVQGSAIRDLITRYKRLNKRLISVRDSLREDTLKKTRFFDEADILKQQLRYQHIAYFQRVGQIAHAFHPKVASIQLPESPKMEMLNVQRGGERGFIGYPNQNIEPDDNNQLSPNVLNFESDEENFDHVNTYPSDTSETQQAIAMQGQVEEDHRLDSEAQEVDVGAQKPVTEANSVGAEEEHHKSAADESNILHNEQPQMAEGENEPNNDSGLQDCLEPNLVLENPDSQAGTIVRYHIIPNEVKADPDEREQKVADSNKGPSNGNSEGCPLVGDPGAVGTSEPRPRSLETSVSSRANHDQDSNGSLGEPQGQPSREVAAQFDTTEGAPQQMATTDLRFTRLTSGRGVTLNLTIRMNVEEMVITGTSLREDEESSDKK